MRISDWSSDVCSSDLGGGGRDDAIAPHDLDAALCQRRTGECAVGLEQGPCLQGPSRSLERVAGRHRLLIERPEALVPGGERPAVVGGLGGVAESAQPFGLHERWTGGTRCLTPRPEQRRVGKECGGTCRSRWWLCH